MTVDEAKEYLEDQDVSVDAVTTKWHVHSNEDWNDDNDEQLVDCYFWTDEQLIEYAEEIKESNGDDEDDEDTED